MTGRTRGKSYGRLNAEAKRERGKLQTVAVKSEGVSDNTQEKSNADVSEKKNTAAALRKNSGQSCMKLNKWIFTFPAIMILFKQLLSCG